MNVSSSPTSTASTTTNESSQVALSVLSASVIWLALVFYYRTKNVYTFWSKRGVPGPRPWPLFGNIAHIVLSDRVRREREWLQKYGKVYGIYLGRQPVLCVSDPEIIRQISIRDFDQMPDHETHKFINKYQQLNVFLLRGHNWSRVRAIMSPTFTSGRVKRMNKLMDTCCDDFIQMIKTRLSPAGTSTCRNGVVNMKDLSYLSALNAIASCCYGLKLSNAAANNKTKATAPPPSSGTLEHFAKIAKMVLSLSLVKLFFFLLMGAKIVKWTKFELFPEADWEPLAQILRQLIETRRKAGEGRQFDDYLQSLLDARIDDKMEMDEMDLNENHHAGLTKDSLIGDKTKLMNKTLNSTHQLTESGGRQQEETDRTNSPPTGVINRLSDEEIVANAVLILVVGLETTSVTITDCLYALAFHQEIQERLYVELKSLATYNPTSNTYTWDYASLNGCAYLDAVVSEALRALVPAPQTDRVPMGGDYFIEKYKITVPKGTKIELMFTQAMSDPDSWPEPHLFNPERFMGAQKEKIIPGSYCPFGFGPRHCLGMRFGLAQTKLTLAKVLLAYKVSPAPKTSYPPKIRMGLFLNEIKRPLVRLEARR